MRLTFVRLVRIVFRHVDMSRRLRLRLLSIVRRIENDARCDARLFDLTRDVIENNF